MRSYPPCQQVILQSQCIVSIVREISRKHLKASMPSMAQSSRFMFLGQNIPEYTSVILKMDKLQSMLMVLILTLLALTSLSHTGKRFDNNIRNQHMREGLVQIRPELYKTTRGVLGSRGKEWHQVRSFVNEDMMRIQSAMFYIDSIDRNSQQLCHVLSSAADQGTGQVTDVLQHVYKWALESISSIFLNTNLGCLDANPSEETQQMINCANTILGPDGYRLISLPAVWKYVKLPYFRQTQ